MIFLKSKRCSSGRHVVSEDKNTAVQAYIKDCAEKGVLQGSAEFQRGLSKIVNRGLKQETRVPCEIGVKGVQGFVYKPKENIADPWWAHILDRQGDILYGFNMYELGLLANDLEVKADLSLRKLPDRKDDRVAVLREMIELAVKKDHSLENCPFYEHFDLDGLSGEYCINCGRDYLKGVK